MSEYVAICRVGGPVGDRALSGEGTAAGTTSVTEPPAPTRQSQCFEQSFLLAVRAVVELIDRLVRRRTVGRRLMPQPSGDLLR